MSRTISISLNNDDGSKIIEEVRNRKLVIYCETQCTIADAVKEAKACYHGAQQRGDRVVAYNGDFYEWTGSAWKLYKPGN